MANVLLKKALSSFVISTGILLSCSALAQEGEEAQLIDNAEALALDAKYYSAMYGVSEKEAMRRLLIMHGSQEEIEALELEYDDKLAGLYFDNGPEFSVNLLLTDDQVPADKKLLRKARKDERKADRQAARKEERKARRNSKFTVTDADIDQAVALIEQPTEFKVKFKGKAKGTKRIQIQKLSQKSEQIDKSIPGLVGTYYSQREGIFVIQVNKDDAQSVGMNEEKLRAVATGILNSPVRIELVEGKNSVESMKGGVSLTNSQGDGMCTAGFVVKDRTTNEVGIVTAGHCSLSQYTYADKDGTKFLLNLKRRQMNGKNDMSFYVPSTKQAAIPNFYVDGSTVSRKLTGFTSQTSTEEKTSSQPGSFICHYGQTTDIQSCGEVVDKTYKPNIVDRNGNSVGCGFTSTPFVPCGDNFVLVEPKYVAGQNDLRCLGGDSGGPWFAYGNAYGIHKGGRHPQKDDPTTTIDDRKVCLGAIYTPIARINDMDLTLYYGY